MTEVDPILLSKHLVMVVEVAGRLICRDCARELVWEDGSIEDVEDHILLMAERENWLVTKKIVRCGRCIEARKKDTNAK